MHSEQKVWAHSFVVTGTVNQSLQIRHLRLDSRLVRPARRGAVWTVNADQTVSSSSQYSSMSAIKSMLLGLRVGCVMVVRRKRDTVFGTTLRHLAN